MTTPDDNLTPLSQQAAEPVDVPSWHGPVTAVTERVTKLEAAQVVFGKDLGEVKTETHAQTVLLGEIKGLLYSPKVRWIALAIAGAAYVYAKSHGIKIPFWEEQ